MGKSGILKSLGLVFLGIIILGILGRMGHMIIGFIMLILSLIGAVYLFKKLTGIEGEVHLRMPEKHSGSGQGTRQREYRSIEHKTEIPGPGQVLCSHCGTGNSADSEICVKCGWPLPAKVKKAAVR